MHVPVFHTRSLGLGRPGAWLVFVSPAASSTHCLYYPALPPPRTHTHVQVHTQSWFPHPSIFIPVPFTPSALTSYLLYMVKPFLSFQPNSCPHFSYRIPLSVWQHSEYLTLPDFFQTLLPSLPDCKVLEGENHIFFVLLVQTAPAIVLWTLQTTCEIELTWIVRTNFKSKCSL